MPVFFRILGRVVWMAWVGVCVGLPIAGLLGFSYTLLLDALLTCMMPRLFNIMDDASLVGNFAGLGGMVCGGLAFGIVGGCHAVRPQMVWLPIARRAMRGAIVGALIGGGVCLINTVAAYMLWPSLTLLWASQFRPEEAHLWLVLMGLLAGFSVGAIGQASQLPQLRQPIATG